MLPQIIETNCNLQKPYPSTYSPETWLNLPNLFQFSGDIWKIFVHVLWQTQTSAWNLTSKCYPNISPRSIHYTLLSKVGVGTTRKEKKRKIWGIAEGENTETSHHGMSIVNKHILFSKIFRRFLPSVRHDIGSQIFSQISRRQFQILSLLSCFRTVSDRCWKSPLRLRRIFFPPNTPVSFLQN